MLRLLQALAVVALAIGMERPGFSADPVGDADRIVVEPSDWPWWRGPDGNGIGAAGQHPPVHWSEQRNVLWKGPVPGRGHGSPTVVGEQVFLATADHRRDVQSVLCYDRRTGRRLWMTDVHRGGLAPKSNKKASQASSTVACDGQRVFVNFLNEGAVHTTALSRGGKLIWQAKISDYVVHQGYGSSPALYRSLVIVSADNKGGGAIAGLDRATGDIVWRVDRPRLPNYTSPVVHRVAGRDQLLFTGCNLVSSFEPLTGKKIWEVEGSTTECVTTTVTDGQLVFTSGGYPKNHTSAVRADGSGELVWSSNDRVYVPSMLVLDRHLYSVGDTGFFTCSRCDTGERVWRRRLDGNFTASPVMAGGHIYATNESGRTFVFKATPQAFQPVAENSLGDEVMATPAICASRIYMRVATIRDGARQEMLYCLGRGE